MSDQKQSVAAPLDVTKARIYFNDGSIHHFENQTFAFAVWLGMPKGIRVAFRGANDARPVKAWDRVDMPA